MRSPDFHANTPFWNLTFAFAMFFGRFFMMIPMLAVAGSMVKKRIHPGGEGTFPVDGPIFVGLLIGVIMLVGALTFFPALSSGPDRRAFRHAARAFLQVRRVNSYG